MLTLCVIDDKLDGIVKSTVQTFYKNKIKTPVFIARNDRMKNSHGLHGFLNINEYKNRICGMNDEFSDIIKNRHGGWFHYITISGSGLSENKRKLNRESSFWKYENIYGEDVVKEYPQLCWLNTTLTHEIHHAWQRDKGTYRVKNKNSIKPDTLLESWTGNIYEYDAEIEANKMRDKTLSHMINIQRCGL